MKILLVLLFPIFVFGVVNPPHRKSQAPFLSRDAFRAYADFVFDELDSNLDPELIRPYNTIYVQTDMLGFFIRKIHPHIPCKYILITNDSDHSFPGPYYPYLEEKKLIAWFGVHYDGYPHPKVHPIPIGTPPFPWCDAEIITQVKAKNLPKIHLAYMQFSLDTFPSERRAVWEYFIKKPFCYYTERKPYEEYLNNVSSSDFCISPRGAGLDTYRLWESLYLGVIPIVKSSSLDDLYSGLPVLIIPDWNVITPKFLKKKYREIKAKTYNLEKLYTDYWFRLIDSYKKVQ